MKYPVDARSLHRTVLALLVVVAAMAIGTDAAWAQFGPLGGPRPAAIGGLAGWVLGEQAMFYRALASMLHRARTDGTALWGLIGISFVYGIFHAAGPGHGKAVISSYLLANEETWRRGITLSFASAVMQSMTAIAIVGIAAVMLGATAKLMGDTVRVIEIASYVLIVLLGARLLWVKGYGLLGAIRDLKAVHAFGPEARNAVQCSHGQHGPSAICNHRNGFSQAQALAEPRAAPTSDHYHCLGDNHTAELDVLPWGHAHGPEPQELAGPGGWRRGLSAVVAVGLRPCSGAIIVLVFALAQGLFWVGIASTLLMGFGTAVTVATIATLAVGTKALAKRLAGRPIGYGSVLVRAVETGAAALILAFGVLLLTGYMASERMGLF
jgi:nickel/cobalt exporter